MRTVRRLRHHRSSLPVMPTVRVARALGKIGRPALQGPHVAVPRADPPFGEDDERVATVEDARHRMDRGLRAGAVEGEQGVERGDDATPCRAQGGDADGIAARRQREDSEQQEGVEPRVMVGRADQWAARREALAALHLHTEEEGKQ